MKAFDLPHDFLIERSLLGCLIIDSSSYDEIVDLRLTPEDFYNPNYGKIFECIKELKESDQAVDYIMVTNRLTQKGQLEAVGGEIEISNIGQEQGSSANVYSYAKSIKNLSSTRNIIRTANRVAELGMNFEGQFDDYVQEVESSFFNLTNDAKSSATVALKEALTVNLKAFSDTKRQKGSINGLTTGFKNLDKRLLGMRPGQMIIIAARPGIGKTALALNIALNACKASGLPIIIFNLEMVASELSLRILAAESKVDMNKLQSNGFDHHDLAKIKTAINTLSNLSIQIGDRGGMTLPEIQSICRKYKTDNKGQLGLVVIDYLQLMQSHTNNPSREQQISEISRGIKAMAKELECPVIALSQLNRSVETNNREPRSSDLRESGAIEQDADVIMLIHRNKLKNDAAPQNSDSETDVDTENKRVDITKIIVDKNRAGEVGEEFLAWIGANQLFTEVVFDARAEYNRASSIAQAQNPGNKPKTF